MPFWLVSLPLSGKRNNGAAWELLQEKTTNLSHNSKFEIPELRVGTLDTLMQLSDDLAKTNNFIDVVVTKLRRQVLDLGGPLAASQLRVKGVTADAYVTRFKWNEAKFQAKRPLKELVEVITESVSKIEDDLKVRMVKKEGADDADNVFGLKL
jgi:V-type H+-transporting ATPase subunit C